MKPREPIDILEQAVPRTGADMSTAILCRAYQPDMYAVHEPKACWGANDRMWLLRIRR